MKKTLFAIALASVVTVANAQKPASGSMGFMGGLGAGITGPVGGAPNTGTLMFKYYAKDNVAARVGLNVANAVGAGETVAFDVTGGDSTKTTTNISTQFSSPKAPPLQALASFPLLAPKPNSMLSLSSKDSTH